MKKKLKERLKDIIIDQIYHYCYNEVVKKIEVGTLKVELPAEGKLQDYPNLPGLINLYADSGHGKMCYDTRNEPFCNLIEGSEPLLSLMETLKSQGYNQRNLHVIHIEKAIQFLVNRSYLRQNAPKKTELALTQKGINHYSTGRSFEETYIKGRNAAIALIISIISIVIAVCAFLSKL